MHSFLANALWSVLMVDVVDVAGVNLSTLTTAIYHDNLVSVMPTTLYRRMAVDRHAGAHSRSLSDFIYKKKTLRRSRIDIWNWDYWCQLQAQKGNCTTARVKYFYNSQLDQCEPFTYSGCNGNKNNFDTLTSCVRYCKGAAYMALKQIGRTIACSLQPNAGLCLSISDKFYYDVNAGTCKVFAYSGCGGNQNRFGMKHKCLEKCEISNEGFVEDK